MGRSLQSAHFTTVTSRTSRDDTQQGRAFEEIQACRDTLPLAWLAIDDAGARFAAFCDLPRRSKDTLVTFCTAMTLTIGLRGGGAEHDTLIAQLEVDFAAYWRPTSDNYFGRLKIGQLTAQFGPLLGQAWLDWHSDAKKAVLVQSLHEHFNAPGIPAADARQTWLPPGF